MSFYPVRGLYVFGYQGTPTTVGPFHEVDKEFMAAKGITSPLDIYMDDIRGRTNPNLIELQKLRQAHLEQQYESLGKAAFIQKWVEFSFSGDEAIGASALIIDNYFRINGNGFLSREPGTHVRSKEHYEKTEFEMWDDNLYINLVYESRRKQKWWHTKPKPNVLSFHLDTLNILEISGTLDKFVIKTKSHHLRFSWDIIIKENATNQE
jgi:hypothetical protein